MGRCMAGGGPRQAPPEGVLLPMSSMLTTFHFPLQFQVHYTKLPVIHQKYSIVSFWRFSQMYLKISKRSGHVEIVSYIYIFLHIFLTGICALITGSPFSSLSSSKYHTEQPQLGYQYGKQSHLDHSSITAQDQSEKLRRNPGELSIPAFSLIN